MPRSVSITMALAVLLLAVLSLVSCDASMTTDVPANRDNSAAAVHNRIMVLDGWLGTGAMPCAADDTELLGKWMRQNVDSGIWWVGSQRDLDSVRCWIDDQHRRVTPATRAGDAPSLHSAGRRSIYLGVIGPRIDQLAGYYAAGVRFARAPATATDEWLNEATRLGFAIDVSLISRATLAARLSRNGPPFLYGWARTVDMMPDTGLVRKLSEDRGGVVLMLPSDTPHVAATGIADMRACLGRVSWEHCAIGGAADPAKLTADLLDAGYAEGNVSRMFGFDMLRVLRKAEIWSGQR